MTYSGQSDVQIQNLLAAVTDALLAERNTLDDIVGQYGAPDQQLEGLLFLIQRLYSALVIVPPSRRFVRRLKTELVGEPEPTLINRVRYLPPRVQIAAGVALVAGFALFVRSRALLEGESDGTGSEIPALQ